MIVHKCVESNFKWNLILNELKELGEITQIHLKLYLYSHTGPVSWHTAYQPANQGLSGYIRDVWAFIPAVMPLYIG